MSKRETEKKLIKDETPEIIAVVLLGLTAQLTAWADEQTEYAAAFEMEGYSEDAQPVPDGALATLEQGQRDNAYGDAFGHVTVIRSIAGHRRLLHKYD